MYYTEFKVTEFYPYAAGAYYYQRKRLLNFVEVWGLTSTLHLPGALIGTLCNPLGAIDAGEILIGSLDPLPCG